MRWTCAELMWHAADTWRHYGSRHEPTQAHVGANMARRTWRKLIGPTGIVGPGKRIGGRTKPSGRRKRIRAFPLKYPIFPLLFFHVGLKFAFDLQAM